LTKIARVVHLKRIFPVPPVLLFQQVRQIGRDQSHVANIIGLCQLSPKIIHTVITGNYPSTLTLNSLKKKLPDLWSEQEAMLLGEN